MSDETAEQLRSPLEPPKEKRITLSVTLCEDGRIEYTLPDNKVLAYGLLGAAHEQLTKMEVVGSLAQAQAQHQAARGGLSGLMKRMNGGH